MELSLSKLPHIVSPFLSHQHIRLILTFYITGAAIIVKRGLELAPRG